MYYAVSIWMPSSSLTAGGASVNASNADSSVNIAGDLALTQNGSFSLGGQFAIADSADVDVTGDLSVSTAERDP